MMMRNLFVREEDNFLIIGSGIFPRWLKHDKPLFFGPTPTVHGLVSVTIVPGSGKLNVEINGKWRQLSPEIQIRIPGYSPVTAAAGEVGEKAEITVSEK
jgi:hypothetical protein